MHEDLCMELYTQISMHILWDTMAESLPFLEVELSISLSYKECNADE